MTVTGLGDMVQQFKFARNTTAIKTDLAALANSLSTGKVQDLARSLGGDTARYTHIAYDLSRIDAFQKTAEEVALSLSGKQSAAKRFDEIRSEIASVLLKVTDLSNGDQVQQAANSSSQAFEDMVSVLNSRIADRSLFAGTSVASRATVPAAEMLNAISATLLPGATVPDIVQAVTDYFSDPVGGFATTGFLGQTAPGPAQRISENRQIAQTPTAADERFTAALSAAAIAAISDQIGSISGTERRELLNQAGEYLHIAADGLTDLRAEIGASEETVANVLAELGARRTTLGTARNALEQSDPFETATELQAVQLQLETHFSAMARLSQLSLLRFL